MDNELLINLQKDLNIYTVDHIDIGIKRSNAANEKAQKNNETGKVDEQFLKNLNNYLKENNKDPITAKQLADPENLKEIAKDLSFSVSADKAFYEYQQKFPEQTNKLISVIKESEMPDYAKKQLFNNIGRMYLDEKPDLGQLTVTTIAAENYIKEYKTYDEATKLTKDIEKEFKLEGSPIAKEFEQIKNALDTAKETYEKTKKPADLERTESILDKYFTFKDEKYDPALKDFTDKKLKESGIDPKSVNTELPSIQDVYNKEMDKFLEDRKKQKTPLTHDKNDDKSAAATPERNEMLKAVSGLAKNTDRSEDIDRKNTGQLISESSYTAGRKKETSNEIFS